MGRTLRLSFAMGGGVSLGTFSGGALTEAIKLLLLYGRDEKGNPYDRVTIDSFSGASAGALSLALMLRGLAAPPPAGTAARQHAIDSLAGQFGKDFTDLQAGDERERGCYEDLVAAQALQGLQAAAWVEAINIRALLGHRGGGRQDLTQVASVMDRGAVDAIAREMLAFDSNPIRFDPRLLAKRVVFACTLASLSPILADARRELPGPEVGYVGLTDGLRSAVHRDLRVFDLHFDHSDIDTRIGQSPESFRAEQGMPERWCRYYVGDEKTGFVGDLRRPRTWAKITATAVASGAVPFAFEPVVLMRKEWEYGSSWPAHLAEAGKTEYPFAFVDGGTFCNEPIREAFRLAAFLDALNPDQEYDRRILFVDPFVSPEELPERLPLLAQVGEDNGKVVPLSSLDRLVGHVGTMLGVVQNESRVVEANKIFQARERFRVRDDIRTLVEGAAALKASNDYFTALKGFCTGLLDSGRSQSVVPPGPLTLAQELERVAAEQGWSQLAGKAAKFCESKSPSDDPDAGIWLRALLDVAVDLVMDLEGKRPQAQLVAIAPFTDVLEYAGKLKAYDGLKEGFRKEWDAYRKAMRALPPPAGLEPPKAPVRPTATSVTLPGGEIGGFAGFMSRGVRQHDFDAGRACAGEFLSACLNLDAAVKLPPMPRPVSWTQHDLAREREEGIKLLADRAGDMVRDFHSGSHVFGGLVLNVVAGFVEGKVEKLRQPSPESGMEPRAYTLEIEVPPGALFRGWTLHPGVEPTRGRDGKLRLVTRAEYDPARLAWSGCCVGSPEKAPYLTLLAPEDGPYPRDEVVCTLLLPSGPALDLAWYLSPNPTLTFTVLETDQGQARIGRPWDWQPGIRPLEETFA